MELSNIIEKRRAYRSLEPVAVDRDLVSDLAGSAVLSLSCFNNQPWRYVFVYQKSRLEELFGALSKGNVWAQGASLIVAVASTQEYDCRIKGRDYYLFDTGMATAFMILRATDLGLVAHPIAGYDELKVKQILGIPDSLTVITLLIVGKHAGRTDPELSEKQAAWEAERPERLAEEKFAFHNEYNKEAEDSDSSL
ncbi:MAG TPA: nitroreductase family protein [Spirochaetota bacterium]|nr:nitroreductase family protein [Spirochaetota bacterium]